jgi:hypothetical protein
MIRYRSVCEPVVRFLGSRRFHKYQADEYWFYVGVAALLALIQSATFLYLYLQRPETARRLDRHLALQLESAAARNTIRAGDRDPPPGDRDGRGA